MIETGLARCPWCSASTAAGDVRCPRCGAALVEIAAGGEPEPAQQIPGLTAVDPALAAARARREATPPRRSRLLSFISGGLPEPDPVPAAAVPVVVDRAAIQPPSLEVKRQMLLMAIEAERGALPNAPAAEVQAEATPPEPADEVAEPPASDGPAPE